MDLHNNSEGRAIAWVNAAYDDDDAETDKDQTRDDCEAEARKPHAGSFGRSRRCRRGDPADYVKVRTQRLMRRASRVSRGRASRTSP
jgi:hypothetical protein